MRTAIFIFAVLYSHALAEEKSSRAAIDPLLASAAAHAERGEYAIANSVYAEAISKAPTNPAAYAGRAYVRLKTNDPVGAILDLNEAIRHAPGQVDLHHMRAIARGQIFDFDGVIEDTSEVIRLNPGHVDAIRMRALTWMVKGDDERALGDYNLAIYLGLTNENILCERGDVRGRLGDYPGELADYSTALRLHPDSWVPHMYLARQLATCPDLRFRDGRRAVEHARLMQQAAGEHSISRKQAETLALAHAEAGDFTQAVAWLERAVHLADAPDKSAHDPTKALFKAGRPYRQLRRPVEAPKP